MSKTPFDFNKLRNVYSAINKVKDYHKLLSVILTKMMELTNADGGTLYVVDDGKLHYRIMKTVSTGFFHEAQEPINLPPIVLNESNIVNVSAYAAIKNEMISIDDVYNDSRFNFEGPKAYDASTGYKTRSMFVFPLNATDMKEKEEVIGVIQLINAVDADTGLPSNFDAYSRSPAFLSLANISANALANILYTKEIKELFRSFAKVMSAAIDERSPYNSNHTRRVALFCEHFSLYLNTRFPKDHEYYFNNYRREQLVMAAFLHDIGKIVTPSEVMNKSDRLGNRIEFIRFRFDLKKQQLAYALLNKELSQEDYEKNLSELDAALNLIEAVNTAFSVNDGELLRLMDLQNLNYTDRDGKTSPLVTEDEMTSLTVRRGNLTANERAIMNEHVSVTARLLDKMRFNKYYRDVPKWAASHHELLDGSGYPLGLKQAELPTEVRILTIMDIYDALAASDRPYKSAMPPEKALAVLREMAEEGKLCGELVGLFEESRVWN